MDGQEVDADRLRSGIEAWADQCEVLVVEGAGGLMSPVTDEEYCADLAYDFGYPLIVVVPNELGCINQALQTLITATTFQDGLEVAGIILNNVDERIDDESKKSNAEEIAKRSLVPILATIEHGAKSTECEDGDQQVDWWELAQVN